MPGKRALAIIIVLLVAVPVGVGVGWRALFGSSAEVGALDEPTATYDQTRFGPLPSLVEVTDAWGLSAWKHTGEARASGGEGIGDVTGDGFPDLIVGGGSLGVFRALPEGGFERIAGTPQGIGDDVTSVGVGFVDADLSLDLLVGTSDGPDAIIFGPLADDLAAAPTTALPGGNATMGLLAGDVTGDGLSDVVRVGYGSDVRPAADVIHVQRTPGDPAERARFEQVDLPDSRRLSLAAEVLDVNGDGLLDIWVGRDIGWRRGGDSVYARPDGAEGRWVDIAPGIGADRRIDAMGITVADLNGDGMLDAYLSDIGENDVLLGGRAGFSASTATGFGRIRPPGAPTEEVSSSWGSGVADLNLDGRTDLVVVNGGFRSEVPNKIPDTEVVTDDSPSLYLGDGRGTFADVWPELGLDARGGFRGLALGDLDQDGDTDIVIVDQFDGLRVFRNDTEGPSLTLRPPRECDPAGVRVAVTVGVGRHEQLFGAHTIFGAHAREVIVGTAGAERARVSIDRPGGTPRGFAVDLPAGRRIVRETCR